MEKTTINWLDIVFDKQKTYLNRLEALCKKRFGQFQLALAEEAGTYVVEKLSENNWHLLSEFSNKSKPSTYLYAITSRLIEDFARKKFGRPRPPEWLKRQGPTWIKIWKMICLERQEIGAVIASLSKQHSRDYLEQTIRAIKGKLPWCGSECREIPIGVLSPASEESKEDHADFEETLPGFQSPDIQSVQEKEQYFEILSVIGLILDNTSEEFDQDNASFKALHQIQKKIALTDHQLIILRMIYEDGFKQEEVARVLKLKRHQLRSICEQAFEKIRQALIDQGLNPKDLLDIGH